MWFISYYNFFSFVCFLLETIAELFKTKTILLLSFCMAYSGKDITKGNIHSFENLSIWEWWKCFDSCCLIEGLELSFYSGVYGTCIGATTQFGDAAKGLIGISGIVVGIGEIIGKPLSVWRNIYFDYHCILVFWLSNGKLGRYFYKTEAWLDVVFCLQEEDCLDLYWKITISGALQLSS